MLSDTELRVIAGRHERDLVYRQPDWPCGACALFAQVEGEPLAVAIDGHLYYPAVQCEPSGRHAHPSLVPATAEQTRADLAALAERLDALPEDADPALRRVRARLGRVDPADPLTDRPALAAAAALLLRRAEREPVGRR